LRALAEDIVWRFHVNRLRLLYVSGL
jgi:hypothetical protein